MIVSKGIYGYWDNKLNYVVYIGKDSNIDAKKNRNYEHHRNFRYDEQPINRVLQNNHDRYTYFKLCEFNNCSDEDLNQLESNAIDIFGTYKYDNPNKLVFNFTKGGEGANGYKHTEEAIQKMRKPKSNTDNYHNPKSEEHKQNISKALKGNKNNLGNTHSEETKEKMSIIMTGENNPMYGKYGRKHHSWKSYARIIGKKGPYELKKNGKRLKRSKYIFNLINWFFENYPEEPLHIEVNKI